MTGDDDASMVQRTTVLRSTTPPYFAHPYGFAR